MTRETLIEKLQSLSAAAFLEEHVFDSVPHVFGGDRSSYVSWKRTLGTAIDVDPACLTVVGSAAIGCSLNPNKNLKQFEAGSDVDVAVVSNYHFTVAWRYLRLNGTRRMKLDAKTRNAWDDRWALPLTLSSNLLGDFWKAGGGKVLASTEGEGKAGNCKVKNHPHFAHPCSSRWSGTHRRDVLHIQITERRTWHRSLRSRLQAHSSMRICSPIR